MNEAPSDYELNNLSFKPKDSRSSNSPRQERQSLQL